MNIFFFIVDNDFDDFNTIYYLEADDMTDALIKAKDFLDMLEAKIRDAFPHWKGKLKITEIRTDGVKILTEKEMDIYVDRLRKNYVVEE